MTRLPTWALALGLVILTARSGRSEEPRTVVEKHFKALLGGDRVPPAAILVRFTVKEGEEPPGKGELFIQSATTRRVMVRHVVEDTVSEEGAIIDGKRGWECLDGTWEKLAREELEDVIRFESMIGTPTLASILTRTNVTVTALKDASVEGRPAHGIKIAFRGPPEAATLYFDKESGLLVKSSLKPKEGPATEVVLSGHGELSSLVDEKLLRSAGVDTTPAVLLAYLKKRAPDAAKLKRVETLVRLLGDDDFETREKAEKELVSVGAMATALLERAAKNADAEVARRARACLKQIIRQNEAETFIAVLRQLVWRRPDGVVAALLAVVPGASEDEVREIKAALVALAETDGKPDPVLAKALDDVNPSVRAVAAAVLGKDDGVYLKQSGRRLFLHGGRFPAHIKVTEDKEVIAEIEIVDVQFFNSFDPKLFTKPR
jgi:hypothetical protein